MLRIDGQAEADSLPPFVEPGEGLEHVLPILLGDAGPFIFDLQVTSPGRIGGRPQAAQRHDAAWGRVFDRVVDQVGHGLFQHPADAEDWQWAQSEGQMHVARSSAVVQGGRDRGDALGYVDGRVAGRTRTPIGAPKHEELSRDMRQPLDADVE